jgi:hypothetical protein
LSHKYLEKEERTVKGKTMLLKFAVIVVVSVCLVSPSMAQTKTSFVRLGSGVPGVLYEPVTPGAKSEIGILVMHPRSDYLAFSPGPELAKRGYRVLCANTSTSKSGFISDFDTDKMISEVKLGVAYLRDYPGNPKIRKVVLLGHSGGGGLMSSYQNIAENGLSACQGPEKLIKCPDSLAGLPKADGLILLDSTIGTGGMTLLSLDPAVVGEEDGQALNPELDMYNSKNGFNPSGSTYSDKFIRQFFEKEKERINRLIEKALDRLEKINARKGHYVDDEPFIVPGGSFAAANNRLFTQDLRLWSHTRKAYPLLRPDGSTVTQVIHSVRVPENVASPTPSLTTGGLTTTVRRFLSTFAVRATDGYGYDADSMTGIDYASSYNSTPSSVAGVTVPLLELGMTGHWEFFMQETIFEHAKSSDKTLAFVEGALHNFTACTKCPGKFGDTEKTTFDYVDKWLGSPGRF